MLKARGIAAVGEFLLNPAPLRADVICNEIPVRMNVPLHLFRLEPAPLERAGEIVHLATSTDVQWGRPIFRAPALPTPLQLSSELPFSVNFPSKRTRRS